MKDSVTYQAIVAEGVEQGLSQGRLQAARDFLLDLGTRRLGPLDRRGAKRIEAIKEYEHLKRLTERLDEVRSWKELLQS